MSRMLNNAEEVARHITLEGSRQDIAHMMMSVGYTLSFADAYAAMVGLLAGLGNGSGIMEASITSDVEGLRESYPASELVRSRDLLIADFTKVVDTRIAARVQKPPSETALPPLPAAMKTLRSIAERPT